MPLWRLETIPKRLLKLYFLVEVHGFLRKYKNIYTKLLQTSSKNILFVKSIQESPERFMSNVIQLSDFHFIKEVPFVFRGVTGKLCLRGVGSSSKCPL